MTTAHKMFTLPIEVIDLLKLEDNASKLVTGLLQDYYGEGADEVEVLKEQFKLTKAEIERLQEKAQKLFNKFTEIEKKREESKELLDKCPSVVESIKKYPKIQLKRDWENMYKKYITWSECLEIYRIIKGKNYKTK